MPCWPSSEPPAASAHHLISPRHWPYPLEERGQAHTASVLPAGLTTPSPLPRVQSRRRRPASATPSSARTKTKHAKLDATRPLSNVHSFVLIWPQQLASLLWLCTRLLSLRCQLSQLVRSAQSSSGRGDRTGTSCNAGHVIDCTRLLAVSPSESICPSLATLSQHAPHLAFALRCTQSRCNMASRSLDTRCSHHSLHCVPRSAYGGDVMCDCRPARCRARLRLRRETVTSFSPRLALRRRGLRTLRRCSAAPPCAQECSAASSVRTGWAAQGRAPPPLPARHSLCY